MKKLVFFLSLVLFPSLALAEECLQFADNIYYVCVDNDQVTSAFARGKHSWKGYGGYYNHPYLVVVFAKPEQTDCKSSQTFFLEFLRSDKLRLNSWTDKCGNSKKDGKVYNSSWE